ncbi:cytosolic sulfotransferase 2-like [Tachysurus vachellii]|uniref:cytosolic sulfotransferase 2-like n=1 Tax=Tachysurus vachellii TaxID=175792 RepID=UPI00296B36CA|nr:cytosolic sulfotransferase 2-like [Tachysurus vachellii]
MDLLRPKLFDFHGVSMTHFFTHNWDKVQNFKAKPDDIVVATYPKAGTTWMCYILDLLYFYQIYPEREKSVPLYERVPFLEVFFPPYPTGTDKADTLPTSPRIIKTHLPVQFLPKSFWEQNCRIVYVARNAKDNVVSYFHFDRMEKMQPQPGDWNSFLQRFKDGKMVFGSWYDHVCGWWEKKQTSSKIHYMFYEDLLEDTGRELKNLCSFLGLSPSDEERKEIVRCVQFDVMKVNSMTNQMDDPTLDSSVSQFMRKGKVGDWKNHFTVSQNDQFDEDYKRKMKNTSLQFREEI